jgi:hypothetical protein
MPENPNIIPEQDKLYSLFNGKNTLEVAYTLADTFVACFGEAWGARGDVLQRLLPKGRAGTWGDLDRHINNFCRQFYENPIQNAGRILLLDNARFVIEALPQRQDYKLYGDKEEYQTPLETAYHFVTCSLCWRAVARRPLEKKTPLCHIHDLPSTSADYRRRARMKPQVEQAKLDLVKALPNLWLLKQEQKTDLNEYLQRLCLDGPLPYLAGYLQSLTKPPHNLPLQTSKDILQALEYPVLYLHKLPPHVQEAWHCYFDDRSQHFKLNYVKIITAEAWLALDDKRKHGGKRR